MTAKQRHEGERAVRYGVALVHKSVVLFRTTHITTNDGTKIVDHEPLLAFASDVGHGSVVAGRCEAEEVESLRERLGTGWQPSVETWFADFQAAYEVGMTRGAALPPSFIYEVQHLPNDVVRIQRWPEGYDHDDAMHALAMHSNGEFVAESEVEHGLKGFYNIAVLGAGGALSEAIAIAERALSWPVADVSSVRFEGEEDEKEEDKEVKSVPTHIEYIITEALNEARTVRISRREVDNSTGELLNVETLLTLRAIEGEPPSSTVLEDCDSVFADVGNAFKDFDVAYISARSWLGLPFQWAAGDDSRILRALRVKEVPAR